MRLVVNRLKSHKKKLRDRAQSARQNKWIKKGDEVIVTSGNHKGATGTVISRTNTHVVVRGVNLRKKAIRRSEAHPEGGHVSHEYPIHCSNVALYSQETGQLRVKKERSDKEVSLVYKTGDTKVTHRVIKSFNG